jgi:hypothetical protein
MRVEPETAALDALRPREYARLDEGGHVYLDYTGAGLTFKLIDSTYTVDGAVADVNTGLVAGPDRFQPTFPYLGLPHDGYDTPA